ncbi:MAG: LysR family transcriptional regulator [Myxococcales bacterium]|nr:LysR family transcriptional regulator [Myxococcales bacterium]
MMSLVELAVFVRAVESKSLSEAARSLGLTPSAVSKRLAKLEERLGLTLLHRTTRHASLTEDGRLFYQRARSILADVAEAEHAVRHGGHEVSGRVRLAVSCLVVRSVLAQRLGALLDEHPALTLELTLGEGELDPMRDGVDVALSWGRHADASLLQRKLTTSPLRVFASRAYLARRGMPKTPAALSGHDCLASSELEKGWAFREGTRRVVVPVTGRLRCSSAAVARDLTLAGLGLARAPALCMGSADAKLGLVTVLDDFGVEERPLFARCAPAQPLSPRVRVVMDWLVEAFR